MRSFQFGGPSAGQGNTLGGLPGIGGLEGYTLQIDEGALAQSQAIMDAMLAAEQQAEAENARTGWGSEADPDAHGGVVGSETTTDEDGNTVTQTWYEDGTTTYEILTTEGDSYTYQFNPDGSYSIGAEYTDGSSEEYFISPDQDGAGPGTEHVNETHTSTDGTVVYVQDGKEVEDADGGFVVVEGSAANLGPIIVVIPLIDGPSPVLDLVTIVIILLLMGRDDEKKKMCEFSSVAAQAKAKSCKVSIDGRQYEGRSYWLDEWSPCVPGYGRCVPY